MDFDIRQKQQIHSQATTTCNLIFKLITASSLLNSHQPTPSPCLLSPTASRVFPTVSLQVASRNNTNKSLTPFQANFNGRQQGQSATNDILYMSRQEQAARKAAESDNASLMSYNSSSGLLKDGSKSSRWTSKKLQEQALKSQVRTSCSLIPIEDSECLLIKSTS